jgi:proteasome lid subunit RPN8/RPN11
VIEVTSTIVAATVDILRSCGQGRRECVVYWPAAGNGQVVAPIHPRHLASSRGYEVDGAWVTNFFLELARRSERVVAQVHSHPGDWVEMSEVDDAYVLLPSPGFLSIVVPRFGRVTDTTGWGIWTLSAEGAWVDANGEVTWTTG